MVMGQGRGYAVNSPLSVPQLKNGDIAAGDFNNNGIDDFLFTGETENGEGYTKLFEGKYRPVQDEATGNYSSYVESNFTFDQLINSSAEWVDYDNDGDLDVAVGNDKAPNFIYFNDFEFKLLLQQFRKEPQQQRLF